MAISEALEETLAAAQNTSYYSQILGEQSRNSLDRIPVTPKSDVRDHPEAFWTPCAGARHVVKESTSGTTGTPLSLRFSREAVRQWFALHEARVRRWNGLKLSDRWAMFGGQVVVPVEAVDPPFWVLNRPMRQLYVSTHHLSRRNAPAIASALCRFQPRYLLGYPSSMALLARFALEDGLKLPEVSVVLSNAETLTPSHRELLSAAFRSPVRDTYGMAEAVAGASECSEGRMHLWPEVGIIEVTQDGSDLPGHIGEPGPLVATGLLNPAMPLMRYALGDRASLLPQTACGCGRTLPALGQLEGRSSDFLVAPDGRHVFWINPVFRDLPVAEAQVIQHDRNNVEVRVLPTGQWRLEHATRLRTRLVERLGTEMNVTVIQVDQIPRDRSGKFRPIVSHLEH